MVLQDLPNTIKQAGDGKGVFEPMAHDFFTPQPVKGMHRYARLLYAGIDCLAASKAYLIRQVKNHSAT